jgi:hypothetical protein
MWMTKKTFALAIILSAMWMAKAKVMIQMTGELQLMEQMYLQTRLPSYLVLRPLCLLLLNYWQTWKFLWLTYGQLCELNDAHKYGITKEMTAAPPTLQQWVSVVRLEGLVWMCWMWMFVNSEI